MSSAVVSGAVHAVAAAGAVLGAALLPYSSFTSENAVLTAALALPAVAAVVVDRRLRRGAVAGGELGTGGRKRRRRPR